MADITDFDKAIQRPHREGQEDRAVIRNANRRRERQRAVKEREELFEAILRNRYRWMYS